MSRDRALRAGALGGLTLTFLVIASMIGAGVFTTSGFALADLHTSARVMAAWALGGALALCGALCYSALVRRFADSGGEYLFLARAVHPAAGFLAGWVSLLAGFTGAIAFAALALEAYALPAALRPTWLPPGGLAACAVLLAGLAHGARLAPGLVAQNVLVAIKLALILALIAAGGAAIPGEGAAWRATPAPVPPFEPLAFALATMWISLSYSGFNAAVYVAGEAAGGAPAVARALLRGTLVVTLLYLALNAVFLYGAPATAIAGHEDVAGRAAQAIGGAPLALVTRVVVVLALATSVSSMVMAGPRVYARMAADGVFPARFAARDGGVPRWAVILQVTLALVVIALADLRTLLGYLGFTLSICSAATVATLFVLRRREGPARVPVPGWPLVPAFYVLGTLSLAVLAAVHRPQEPLAGVATVATGLLAYRLFRRR